MKKATALSTAASIRTALRGNSSIHAWQVRTVERAGVQTYLVKTEEEGERFVRGDTHEVTVFVKNGDKIGRAVVNLGTGDEDVLSKRIEDAVYMAGLGGDKPWQLPAAAKWPEISISDPALSADRARATSRDLAATWRAAVGGYSGVRPSSMELFCGEETTRLQNSAGLNGNVTATRISLLTLLLAAGGHPSERYSWDERRRVADLNVAGIVRRVAEEARDLTQAVPPPSGEYAVMIDADEMAAFLSPIQGNASAEVLYQKSSRFEVGKPLPSAEGGTGEPLTVISNATKPYGLTSYAFDNTGVAGQRVEIVKDGLFVRPWATKQFADYLAVTPTGTFANWEVPPGKTPLADLTGNGRVLYVRAFSWLTPDQGRGDFASEVRVGYLYENGKRTPIKGGTVSGNVFKALATAHWSKETAFTGDYDGPAAVRLEGLTVSGA